MTIFENLEAFSIVDVENQALGPSRGPPNRVMVLALDPNRHMPRLHSAALVTT